MNILLVEDSQMAAMGAKIVLQTGFNATVIVAETGKQAIALAEKPFDLILMDIGLPDTDGFTLTREIHEKCLANQNTKVIAVTAHADESYKDKVTEYGLVGLISKPLTLDNFTKILKENGININ